MRVRAFIGRKGGPYLPEIVRVGGTPPPFQLMVVAVTDQGKRRPSKVVRPYATGSKATVAQLASVLKMVHYNNDYLIY